MNKFKTHEEFFSYLEDDYMDVYSCGGFITNVTVEELYQHFKARLVNELIVSSPELLNDAELVDFEFKEPEK